MGLNNAQSFPTWDAGLLGKFRTLLMFRSRARASAAARFSASADAAGSGASGEPPPELPLNSAGARGIDEAIFTEETAGTPGSGETAATAPESPGRPDRAEASPPEGATPGDRIAETGTSATRFNPAALFKGGAPATPLPTTPFPTGDPVSGGISTASGTSSGIGSRSRASASPERGTPTAASFKRAGGHHATTCASASPSTSAQTPATASAARL